MGTRADFYTRSESKVEWLGSTAWDGGEMHDPNNPIMSATTEDEFVSAVMTEFARRDDATMPADGWPWPWERSWTTDYTYAFNISTGETEVYLFGHLLDQVDEDGYPCYDEKDDKAEWMPDMTDKQNVTLGKRSGVMFFTES